MPDLPEETEAAQAEAPNAATPAVSATEQAAEAPARKRPKPGEFRVQEHYGGSPEATPPSESLLRQAHAVLAALPRIPEAACPTPPCYARIDGVCDGDRFLLMELELIEPALFFAYTQGGEERLARAVRRSLQRAGLA